MTRAGIKLQPLEALPEPAREHHPRRRVTLTGTGLSDTDAIGVSSHRD